MQTNYALYYFSTCPYCIKVLAYMKFKGIEMPLKNINKTATYNQELITEGGKRQVPCLRIATDEEVEWLYESSDIIKYLKREMI